MQMNHLEQAASPEPLTCHKPVENTIPRAAAPRAAILSLNQLCRKGTGLKTGLFPHTPLTKDGNGSAQCLSTAVMTSHRLPGRDGDQAVGCRSLDLGQD